MITISLVALLWSHDEILISLFSSIFIFPLRLVCLEASSLCCGVCLAPSGVSPWYFEECFDRVHLCQGWVSICQLYGSDAQRPDITAGIIRIIILLFTRDHLHTEKHTDVKLHKYNTQSVKPIWIKSTYFYIFFSGILGESPRWGIKLTEQNDLAIQCSFSHHLGKRFI